MEGKYLTCQIVRPDRLIYEGPAASIVLQTYTGELAVYPLHSALIVALGDGVVRVRPLPEDGGGEFKIVVSGGYAEVYHDTVTVLADHARLSTDIDVEEVQATLAAAQDMLEKLEEGDHRNAYYENKINWCKLLLKHAPEESKPVMHSSGG